VPPAEYITIIENAKGWQLLSSEGKSKIRVQKRPLNVAACDRREKALGHVHSFITKRCGTNEMG
jgi:hypothetical protein